MQGFVCISDATYGHLGDPHRWSYVYAQRPLLLEVDRTDMDAHVDHFRHEMQWFACIFNTDYGHCDE